MGLFTTPSKERVIMQLYFDCFSGISGDMTLGAFIDLGVPVEWLKAELTRLPLENFDITVEKISRNGINAKNVFVHDDIKAHPMDYNKIKTLILSGPHSENVKNLSLTIFEKIADAESNIHGCPKHKIHFHEVGGIDAIVDIVGTALCVEYLGVTKITASKIPTGSGFVKCSHGTIPVPAPATIAILKDIPVYGTDIKKEIVTPTGAAIISALSESFGDMPEMIIDKIGYGSGKRDLADRPNLLRIVAGKDSEKAHEEDVVIVETAIDDMNPEIYSFLMERLFEDGALDVYWQPVYMKKNRPGTVVTVLCTTENREKIVNRILTETTTSGVKFYRAQRSVLERKLIEIDTCFGKIQAKEIIGIDGRARVVPEYEECKKIALENKLPIKDVYEQIKN